MKSSFEALVQSDNGDPRAELGTLIIHADICHHNTQEHFRSVDIFTNKWLCLYLQLHQFNGSFRVTNNFSDTFNLIKISPVK